MSPPPQTGGSWRRHWMLLVLLGAGAGLRVLTVLAYQPAILYIDSFTYLDNLHRLRPDGPRPIGYDLILNLLLPFGGLRAVALVQHLLGLGIAVLIYLLVLRHGARRWLAALASAPLLLDAYQVQIEHNIMPDVWFQALLAVIAAVLTWRGLPRPWQAASAGVLIGCAVAVRLVGITLVVPALVYLIVAGSLWARGRSGRPKRWRHSGLRCAALAAGFAVLLTGYAGYYRITAGVWGISGAGGAVLYGRAAVIADCAGLPVGSGERALCPVQPREHRFGVDYYVHDPASPALSAALRPGESLDAIQASFARRVFAHQPRDLALAILTDFGKGFRPRRVDAVNDVPVQRWQFQTSYPYWGIQSRVAARAFQFGGVPISVNPAVAQLLRDYQLTVGYTPGPLLGLGLVAGLLGGLLGGGRRSRICVGPQQAASLLASGLGGTVLITAAAFEFSWRYQLPGLVLLPMAGALGLTALGSKPTPALAPYPDPVDTAAAGEFVRVQGEVRFAPVVVIIAAYNEEDCLGAVLADIPATSCGLPVDTLVITDGCTDGTAEVARHHGARVCEVPSNRGQGAALRLGYALARRGGARYVVTTDADGQYDLAELPLLLQPLIDDEADFVTGSRALGRQETADPVRHLGVRVFAALASALTRQRLTDTSFGFRAMKADLTAVVTLSQPQYQASELLLGMISHGYRVLEQPMTMRRRTAGTTKKGTNFRYGMRYARVLVGTWWRESGARRCAPPNTNRSSKANLSTNSGR